MLWSRSQIDGSVILHPSAFILHPSRVDILYLLIPLSLVLVVLIGGVFLWSVNNGQFDDLEGPAQRILDDDE
jgi:cbb3-type cytochrome oxidase maturation protein